jgi:hypothetical protein
MLEAGKRQCKGSEEAAICSRGASRGICTLWNNAELKVIQITYSQHWIYTNVTNRATSRHFKIFNIYAPMHYIEKQECWHTLEEMKESIDVEFCIMARDFNMVLSQEEKHGGSMV